MDGESEDVTGALLSELQSLVPSAFSEGRVDCKALREVLGQDAVVNDTEESYGLSWTGRQRAFEQVRERTTKTLKRDLEGSVNFDTAEHLFIEGDNLDVIKLLQNAYADRVKLIYIDPPYNTGKDFVYRDRFEETKSEYEERTGQRDSDRGRLVSNPDTSGRYHSDWLTMMYPRLFLARNLLEEDGLLFVSIDDNEVHNLRLILDEIFGRENFIANIIWNSTKSVTNTALISENHTHNLVYAKEKDYFIEHREEFRLPASDDGFTNPDDDPRGPWKADPFQVGGWRPNQQYEIENPHTGEVYTPNEGNSWKNDYETFLELQEADRIVFGKTGTGEPKRKRFWSEAKERGSVTTTVWDDIDTTTQATVNFRDQMGDDYFNNPKPVELISRIIQLGTNSSSDIILDFFAGSGTTAHAVLDFNEREGTSHQFICVQLDEATPEDSPAREAGFETIAEIARERIRRVIEPPETDPAQERLIESEPATGFKSFVLGESNLRAWNPPEDIEDLQQQLLQHQSTLIPGAETMDVLYELGIKEGFTHNAEIDQLDVEGTTFYTIREDESVLVFTLSEKLTKAQLDRIDIAAHATVYCLDSALTDSEKDTIGRTYALSTI